MAATVRLLIIDEVHLLNDERGPVIETLVARTCRQVESSQSMIRIVGLSATLPNYKDVGDFLGVNTETGAVRGGGVGGAGGSSCLDTLEPKRRVWLPFCDCF